jgi:hypothetical protein
MYFKTNIRFAKWVKKAPQNSYEQTYVNSLTVFNGQLYAGTYESGLLFEWNDSNAWVLRAGPIGTPPNDEYEICSLVVFNGKLYGGTAPHGKLVEWNGSNAWVEKAPQFGDETYIYSLAVFNSKLYAGTYPHGKLLEWNGSSAWAEKAPQTGSETAVHSLTVFNGKLYGGTAPHGKLLEWNGVDAWVEKAPQPGSETQIHSLAIFNDKLYGGGYTIGKLLEWNGIDAWVEKAAQLGSDTIRSLMVFRDKLYAGTYNSNYANGGGKLLEWNGIDAWVEKVQQLHTQNEILSLVVFNEELYAGTAPDSMLFMLDWARRAVKKTEPRFKIYVAPPEVILDENTIERYAIMPQSISLKRPSQDEKIKPRELELTVDRRVPITLFGHVVVTDEGAVAFNGYVERQTSLTKTKRRFLCKGNEAKLSSRFMPKLPFMGSILTQFLYVISDKYLPGGSTYWPYNPGIMFCANSYWPPGTPYTIYDSSNNIILLKYVDTHVDVGAAVGFVQKDGRMNMLVRYPNLSDLQTYDYSYYIAPNKDIYIRVSGSNWYAVGGLFFENMFDTRCRIGEQEIYWNRFLKGVVSTDLDEIATLLFKLFKRHGYYLRLRDDYNYTYFDLSITNGRNTGVTIYEKDLLDFDRSSPSQPTIQAAIVRGGGRQFSSIMDGRVNSGLFALQTYDGTYNRDLGMLKDLSSEYLNQRNSADTVTLKHSNDVYKSLCPGDLVYLALDEEPVESFKIAQITNSDDKTTTQLGIRRPGLAEIWQDKLSANVFDDRALYEILPAYSESVTFKPRDSGHQTCTHGNLTINFPSGVIGPMGKRFLALLDLSLSLDQAAIAAGEAGWTIIVKINGESGDWGKMNEVSLDDGLSEVDITDLLVEGANTIEIYATYLSEFSTAHGGCNEGEMFPGIDWIEDEPQWNGHPDLTANVSIKFYRMNFI